MIELTSSCVALHSYTSKDVNSIIKTNNYIQGLTFCPLCYTNLDVEHIYIILFAKYDNVMYYILLKKKKKNYLLMCAEKIYVGFFWNKIGKKKKYLYKLVHIYHAIQNFS